MEMVSDRIRLIITAETTDRGRPMLLESETGIPAETWRKFMAGKQNATLTMLESVAKRWPDYAYWLACGDTEPEHGHVAPASFESSYPIIRGEVQNSAREERAYKQRLLAQAPTDPEERAKRDRELRDTVFEIREQLIMPAVHLNFERIMRAQNQEAKDDLFMLEYDDDLRKIRINRWEEESKILKKIHDERVLMGQSIKLEKVGATGKKLLRKAWEILRLPFTK